MLCHFIPTRTTFVNFYFLHINRFLLITIAPIKGQPLLHRKPKIVGSILGSCNIVVSAPKTEAELFWRHLQTKSTRSVFSQLDKKSLI